MRSCSPEIKFLNANCKMYHNEDEDAKAILPVSRGIFSLYCKICAKIMNLE
jgi:hypothetical protein